MVRETGGGAKVRCRCRCCCCCRCLPPLFAAAAAV